MFAEVTNEKLVERWGGFLPPPAYPEYGEEVALKF